MSTPVNSKATVDIQQSHSQAFSIPTHLSSEAKEYLSTVEIVGGPIENVKIFDLARKGFAESTQIASNLAEAQYVDSLKEKEIAGVPCGDVQIRANPNEKNQKVVLYFHGGAFTLGSWKNLMHVSPPHSGKSRRYLG